MPPKAVKAASYQRSRGPQNVDELSRRVNVFGSANLADIQAARLPRRFRFAAATARLVARLAFGEARST